MKTFIPSRGLRRGFTLIELLTVIAIIGILAAILIPTVSRVRESAKRAKCMSNVRQITIGLINAANQNKGQTFPSNDAGAWAWDVSHSVAKDIVSSAGQEVFYCPSSSMLVEETLERMWTYGGSVNSFAVTGYVLLVPKTRQIADDFKNDRIRSDYPYPLASPTRMIPASRRLLVVDAVISESAAMSSFANVTIGGLKVNKSNHMQSGMPLGGHSGYVDGHVKWRSFERASASNPDGYDMRNNTTSPRFWF